MSEPAPTLLLIDDEPALAAFLADAARISGFEPIVAANEGQFKAYFAAARPAMIALDLGMPDMDGIEFLRFLAAEHYDGAVLIISGFDRRVLESAFNLGEALGLKMAGPLEKPTLVEDIERLLADVRPTLVQ